MAFPDLTPKLGSWIAGLRGRLMSNVDMSAITWFRVGGPAQLLFQPRDSDDLSYFLRQLPKDVPVLVVGVGSNLLVRDGGIPGVVIRLSARGFGDLTQEGETGIRAGAGVPDKRLAAFALEKGIGGFAFYHGIPGAVGGALRMNAGANGVETTDRVVSVTAIDRDGERHSLSHAEMGYAYRHSSTANDLIFVDALFEGFRDDPAAIRAAMDAVQHHRETVQPIRERTGGSTFKNPEGNSAWRLIDAAGCRGLKIGGAQMSEMHCNFMINTGNATATDLEMLGETVRARVFKHSGFWLEWEIKRLGLLPEGVEIPDFTDQNTAISRSTS